MEKNKREIGACYEAKTAEYLKGLGYRILAMNYRCKIGEIDIVAQDKSYLVFVEVKYRIGNRYGSPLEAVDRKKQKIISRVAQYYCLTHGCALSLPCRFDVAAFEGENFIYMEHAFEFIER